MPSTILSAWGKVVNFVGSQRRKNVDGRPQMSVYTTTRPRQHVYNHSFVPDLTNLFPQFFPQAIYTQLHLLISLFSPLSTLPITTTTNLKSKER